MRVPTASKVGIAMACPASHALPWAHDEGSPDAERGRTIHTYLEVAQRTTRDAALAGVSDPELRAICEGIDLGEIPPGAEPEVALAWDCDSGRGKRLRPDRPRGYGDDGRWYGTLDLAGRASDGAAWLRDYKTGSRTTEAPDNWQLRTQAVLLAAATGADSVDAGMLYLRSDGRWWPDLVRWDGLDLAGFADELRALRGRIQAAALEVDAGRVPETRSGPHCRYCPALRHCPSQVGLVRAIVPDLQNVEAAVADLTPEQAVAACVRVAEAKRLIKRVEDALDLLAAATVDGLPLPGGGWMREIISSRRTLLAPTALRVLRDRVGEDAALAAATVPLKAVGEASLAAGIDPSEIVSAIEVAGGVTTREYRKVQAVGKGSRGPRKKE